MAVTVSDVEALDSMGWDQLDNAKKQALLDIAESEAQSLYGGDLSTFSEIEGSTDDFIKYLAAHKWELAEGGETQSESSSGGSVNYNTVTGESTDTLEQTRYGREALKYIREGMSVSFVTTY